MLRSNSRRRPPPLSAQHICVAASAASLLLLLSLLVLHSRLSSSPREPPSLPSLLLDDADNDSFDGSADDLIDALDRVDDLDPSPDDLEDDPEPNPTTSSSASSFVWDHLLGVKRQVFGRPLNADDDPKQRYAASFASDDLPADGEVRAKMASIRGIEDALLVKASGSSPLREGWAKWFEAKGRFLRSDRMYGSGMEVLNPMNHPLLQDPDAVGGAGLTRGDRMVRKAVWKELEGVEFVAARKVLNSVERKVLSLGSNDNAGRRRKGGSGAKPGKVRADFKKWGYYPGINLGSSFSVFVERFFGDVGGRCGLRVFMVWNSPPWMFGVRQQRGLESLLHHHKDACVLVLSETLELDYFADIVEDGFKVAVAMPNLDELLKDTPLIIFASVWAQWRMTEYYPIHYSDLIRLAALYKYGGMYLDFDIIVLKSLESLENTLGMEESHTGEFIPNGAVMAFPKHSPFIMQCMNELYSTYNDKLMRWNGAELLHRLIKLGIHNHDAKMPIMKDPYVFFPISSSNITSYFSAAADETERYQQDTLLERILDRSLTFHLWNGETNALVPETGSLVERLINHYCLYCLDVL